MAALSVALRGVIHRGGATLSLAVVAVVAVAAVTAAPTYYAASQDSILQDSIRQADVVQRGFEVTQTGPVAGTITGFAGRVQTELSAHAGGDPAVRQMFGQPVTAVEASVLYGDESLLLVSRSRMCAHLTFAAGHCPSGEGEAAVSGSLARLNGWRPGQRITMAGWQPMVISGVYRVGPATGTGTYWFDSASRYFPAELAPSTLPTYDAVFTAQATIDAGPATAQGSDVADYVLQPGQVRAAELPALQTAVNGMLNDVALQGLGATVVSQIPDLVTTVEASFHSLAVAALLITAEVLLLVWVLLYLIVTEAAQARGPEVALARLRGHGRLRTFGFALTEPVLVLVTAVPAGLAAGWAAAVAAARILLRPGTPVALPPLGWIAATLATAGGLIAVLVAARRALAGGVVTQWQRASRRAAVRGWVIDAIVVTATVAGLAELGFTGRLGSAGQGPLALLVPGLLGAAVAVTGSRLLVVASRWGFGLSRRLRATGAYLALRQVARRSGGSRSATVLATAFSLATFAVGIWSVTLANVGQVADAQVGAAAVLTVTPPPGRDLGSIVDRIDPAGHTAMAVTEYTSASGANAGETLLAVDPQRYAAIAAWRPQWAGASLASIMRSLRPPALPPVVLTGQAVRVSYAGVSAEPAGSRLSLDVYELGAQATGQTPVDLGPIQDGTSAPAPLTGCPCVLADLAVQPPATGRAGATTPGGALTITGIQVSSAAGRWAGVSAGLTHPGAWLPGTYQGVTSPGPNATGDLHAGAAGLRWVLHPPPGVDPVAISADRPYPLPALVAATVTGEDGPYQATGLDGNPLQVSVVAAAAAIPGAPSNGIVVDRAYAQRAAGTPSELVTEQVWVAPGGLARVRSGLAAAGVVIGSQQTAGSLRALLLRQGPALATALFLADACAAALLAAAAAVSWLYLSARRRRHEYAALAASRVPRKALRRALLIEHRVRAGLGVRRDPAGRAPRARVRQPAHRAATAVPATGGPVHAAAGRGRGAAGGGDDNRQRAAHPQRPSRPAPRGRTVTGPASATGAGPAIHCESLVHVYGTPGSEVAALRGIDLRVEPGETLALLGPSGAGKTTLLWHLAGLLRPTAGTVEVLGHRLAELDGAMLTSFRLREVGLLLQEPGRNLLPYQTAAGNVAFAQAPTRRSRGAKRKRTAALLERVGLAHVARQPAGRLSGGEQQRLAVAVALANGPGLLLADEPTAQLDPGSAAAVIELIRDANASLGTTVVAVTHDPAVASALGRTVTIRDGLVGGEGRGGVDYLVVGRGGGLQLPPEVLAVLPPGTLVQAVHHNDGVLLRRVADAGPDGGPA
jgi:ABC-type lipoprotein export system ATPase subunit